MPSRDAVALSQKPIAMDKIRAAVGHALALSGIPDDQVSSLAQSVHSLNELGVIPRRVFPKGQPPVIDGAWVEGLASAHQLGAVLGGTDAAQFIDEIRLFPYGIPFPEIYRVQVGIH